MSATVRAGIRCADHIGFAVASLDEALCFWIDGLGATLLRRNERTGAFLSEVTGAPAGVSAEIALVELAGQTIELLDYSGTDRPQAPGRPFDPGFAHLALVVDDLDAVVERVAPFGWKPQGVPQPIPAGPRAGTRVVYVVAPDGATIELMQPQA